MTNNLFRILTTVFRFQGQKNEELKRPVGPTQSTDTGDSHGDKAAEA
jgi:hypothetical protein